MGTTLSPSGGARMICKILLEPSDRAAKQSRQPSNVMGGERVQARPDDTSTDWRITVGGRDGQRRAATIRRCQSKAERKADVPLLADIKARPDALRGLD
jgi:hypothetical protein